MSNFSDGDFFLTDENPQNGRMHLTADTVQVVTVIGGGVNSELTQISIYLSWQNEAICSWIVVKTEAAAFQTGRGLEQPRELLTKSISVIRRLKDLRREEGGANPCELWCGGDFFISRFRQFYFSKFTSDSPSHLRADGNCQQASGQDEDLCETTENVPARTQTINSKPLETRNLHCSQGKTLRSGGAVITSCHHTKR